MAKRLLLVFYLSSLMSACDFFNHRHYHDPSLKLHKEDYEKITKPPLVKTINPPFRPKLLPFVIPPILTPAMKKKVSLTLHEQIPFKNVLMELGRQAGVGIAISPHITSDKIGMFYSVHQLPFIDVIKDFCFLTNHRFQIQGNRILIEPDLPYLTTYNIQFLNHIRKSENRISVSTDVFSPLENQKRTDNGSESVLSGSTLMDFWKELEQNLKMILMSEKGVSLKDLCHYTLHKQGGLIMVFGTAQQHQEISEYLRKLKEATSTQVVIEAKIVEVTLYNEYRSGIHWDQLGEHLKATVPLGALASSISSRGSQFSARDTYTFSVEEDKFSMVLNLVKKFGTARTLSNPRLTVMNNQPAMLKVATNEVFFHLEFERFLQEESKPDIENISSEALTVPIGLVMIVQPSINIETGEITMTLRPTISRIQKEVEDPAVAIKSHQKVKSTIPVVQVRELDSVLKIKSGEVLVMGGLMEDRSNHMSASVPIADSIPFLGDLTKGKDDDRQITELVIFLTAHIVESPHIVGADERIYNTYVEDPRPLYF